MVGYYVALAYRTLTGFICPTLPDPHFGIGGGRRGPSRFWGGPCRHGQWLSGIQFSLPAIMLEVKYLTWNVRGLRAKPKQNAVLSYLKTQCADLMVFVETHLTGQLQMALKKPWVG